MVLQGKLFFFYRFVCELCSICVRELSSQLRGNFILQFQTESDSVNLMCAVETDDLFLSFEFCSRQLKLFHILGMRIRSEHSVRTRTPLGNRIQV